MKTIKIKEGLPISEILKKYPDLVRPCLISQNPPKIDLKNRDALAVYNKLVAREILRVELSLHPKALVPSIMSRLEFVKLTVKPHETVLDVGTGSTAICAIIAAKILGAKVYATEMVEEYYLNAHINIIQNSLQDRIQLVKSSGQIIDGVIPEDLNFDAIISTPPYLPSKVKPLGKKFGGSAEELLGGGKTGAEFSLKLIKQGAPHLKRGGRIGLIIPMKKETVAECITHAMKEEKLRVQNIRLITGNRERRIIIGKKN